jgi:N utilization substance protein A
MDTRGPQILLSRTHPNFLISLFKTEVPEISEGIVDIKGAAREPGSRAKFAVASNDADIDPVGACVGMKGSRVQNVVQELRGEKIDIISWHVDAAKYVCNALAPAEISRVIIDEDNRGMEVIVPDESLSVAIGKRGQNVRLASKLTGWHLDVKSESKYSQDMKKGYDSLVAIPEMAVGLADALYESGFYSADELSRSSADDLMQVRGMTEEKALELIDAAQAYLEDKARSDLAEKEREARDEDVPVSDTSQSNGDSVEVAGTGNRADGNATENESSDEADEARRAIVTIDRGVNGSAEA